VTGIRHDWTQKEVFDLMNSELSELLSRARVVHQEHAAQDVQQCVLLSVKTGACPENCKYCSQSAHYKTQLSAEPLMDVEKVTQAAWQAKESGATRFCMGAAWRSIPRGPKFDAVVGMVREVAKTGMEVCCTLGMADEDQLTALKEAGLTAYNHNLDTSREFYSEVITTRTYDDRLRTLAAARKAGVQLCCGGILGLGESIWDRAGLLTELATMSPHPESVPINLLVPIEGTPLEKTQDVSFDEFLRTIATARILMPESRVRLSAGRNSLSEDQQLACFSAGANSIFVGEKLLTTPNVAWEQDRAMMTQLL
jgi:biotin synthase